MALTRTQIEAATRARLEDATWLAETGENLSGAAQRLGLNRDALDQFLYRNAPHIRQQLLAREPRDHNGRQDPRSAA